MLPLRNTLHSLVCFLGGQFQSFCPSLPLAAHWPAILRWAWKCLCVSSGSGNSPRNILRRVATSLEWNSPESRSISVPLFRASFRICCLMLLPGTRNKPSALRSAQQRGEKEHWIIRSWFPTFLLKQFPPLSRAWQQTSGNCIQRHDFKLSPISRESPCTEGNRPTYLLGDSGEQLLSAVPNSCCWRTQSFSLSAPDWGGLDRYTLG